MPTGDLSFTTSGNHGGAILTLMGSYDGVAFRPITGPLRSPRNGRLGDGVKFVRPWVDGGTARTRIDVTVDRR
jgi:hypothetical protein